MGSNKHHMFYVRRQWRIGLARTLRAYSYCVVRIPVPLHERIHAEVPSVPVPSAISIREAIDQLDYLGRFKAVSCHDKIEKRLQVLIALFDCIEPETTEALRKQLKIVREFYNTPRA